MIYLCHPRNGGPIKIGASKDVTARMDGLNGWTPDGLELLCTLPGYNCREAALHWLFRDRRHQFEWFVPSARLWRFIGDVQDGDAMDWLPPEPERRDMTGADLYDEAVEYFGSPENLCEVMGYKRGSLATVRDSWGIPAPFWGRYQAERAIREGLVPAYLRPPVDPAEAA